MGGSYEKKGSAKDVKNVNPYTSDFMDQMTNDYNQYKSMFDQSITDYSPEAAYNYFFDTFAPKMMDVMDPVTNKMAKSQTDLAAMLSEKGQRDAMSTLAGNDLLYSGATPQMVSQAAQIPYMEAVNNITTAQTGIMGNLLNTGLGTIPGSFQGQQELYGNIMMGTQGNMGQMAAPEWWQPTYVPKKGLLDYAVDAATMLQVLLLLGLTPVLFLLEPEKQYQEH